MKVKNIMIASVILSAVVIPAHANSLTKTGCEGKRQEIVSQIHQAQHHANTSRVSGLEKALSELDANCTDKSLRAEREARVKEKEFKVSKRRDELNNAKADGRSEKIRKKELKLKEAEDELMEAQKELSR